MSPGNATVDAKIADAALNRLEVDGLGLDAMDRRYLMMIADVYRGGPVGVETLAAGLSEPRDTVEEVIEPYLIQLGLIAPHRAGPLPQRGRLEAFGPQPAGQFAGWAVRLGLGVGSRDACRADATSSPTRHAGLDMGSLWSSGLSMACWFSLSICGWQV